MSEVSGVQDQILNFEGNAVALGDYFETLSVKPGQRVNGRPGVSRADQVLVYLEDGKTGFVPAAELALDAEMAPDAVRSFYVESDENGEWVLSRRKALRFELAESLQAAADAGTPVFGTVLSRVQGGLSVDVGMKAFMPLREAGTKHLREAYDLIGKRCAFKVLQFALRKGIRVSRLALMEQSSAALKAQLVEGQEIEGVVKTLTRFGAFVEIADGVDGLLHIADMSHRHLDRPGDAVQVGERLRLKILDVDLEKGRVRLGLKQLLPDPWAEIESLYPKDAVVQGKVVKVAGFGLWVQLPNGVEGVVQKKDLDWSRKVSLKQFAIGDEVTVKVMEVSSEKRRLRLSIRDAQPDPWTGLKEKYPAGTRLALTIRSIAPFGLFVAVEEGIDGLVHLSDVAWGVSNPNLSELYHKGQEIEVMVLDVDVEARKMSLGIKQLTANKRAELYAHWSVGQEVEGKVVRLRDFGAWIELEPTLEGLLHVREMPLEPHAKAQDLLHVGESVKVRIVSIDVENEKISLSMKPEADQKPLEPASDAQEAKSEDATPAVSESEAKSEDATPDVSEPEAKSEDVTPEDSSSKDTVEG